jgi:uncharacterized protein (TIGR02452 family)
MADRPLPESPVHSPDGATPPSAWDDTLMRAIDAGQLDASQAADASLAGAFAAHQKLESLFAALRGQPDADPDTEAEPAPTQLGRYVIGGLAGSPDAAILGAGAFGTVYLAYDPELNREVAIKVSSRSLAKPARARADAIATEARHAASLNHPGIVTIHDVGRDGERLYIVMQYIRGQTLEQLLREGPVPPARAAELLASVADALHDAHKRGFVHRDLKPANILLDEQGGPHVADFGLAVSEETQRALGGQVAGTPAYMSPEQCRGDAHRLDGRTDIWSLGVISYELLTGRQPFWRGDVRTCLDEIRHRDPKPPRQIDHTLPADLERIILICLAKQPTDRYFTAGEVAADFRRWGVRQASRMQGITRAQAAKLGSETLRILEAGCYWTAGGHRVAIGELVDRCVDGTCSYPPGWRLPDRRLGNEQTLTEIVNESTLAAARKLIDEGFHPLVLNFASAKCPGGGFLTDACAQEESLARCSALFACLSGNGMYELHQLAGDPMYTAYAVYSPDVPVFRDDAGYLLPEPYLCSFVSSPAVNAKAVLRRNRARGLEIREAMWERILKVLAIAAKHGREALVLGAWGCGAFGNDSEEIASLFERSLNDCFAGAFRRIVFAILDWSAEERFIGPFKKAFAG